MQFADNFKIQLIQKILTVGNKIFLVQFGRGINEIYCLDFDGNLLYVINDVGEGPFEYTEIQDVYFDISGQYLILLDRPTKKRIYFTLEGEPIKEDFNLANLYLDETYAVNGLYLSVNGLYYAGNQRLLIMDKEGKVVDSHLSYDDALDNVAFGGKNVLSKKSEQKINFTSGRREFIYEYSIDSGIVRADYMIDFNNTKTLKDDMSTIELINFMVDSPMHRIMISYVYQNANYLKFSFAQDRQLKQAFVDKQTLGLIVPDELENDLFNSPLDQVMGITEDGKFIARIKPDMILLEKGLFKDDSLNEQYRTRTEDISDPEDPILFVFNLKF